MPKKLQPARRLAVILFNLGGPDQLRSVRPFLFNLFCDPAIIGAPAFIRYPLAGLISWLREHSAKANYARMGGASPLLPETEAQAEALDAAFNALAHDRVVKCFIAMRHWKPFIAQVAKKVADFSPDDVVLLPLYPQYSITTTGSSLKEWARNYKGSGRVHILCCYPIMDGFIKAHAKMIREAWIAAGSPSDVQLLFSAHGLPKTVVDGGDPYQSQVEATAKAVASHLEDILPNWKICYQSKLGPVPWIGPSTSEAIIEAISEGLGIVVTPIAFVSEHIETLVELDHDYAVMAEEAGCRHYIRVPALGVQPDFIEGLTAMTLAAAGCERPVSPGSDFVCDDHWEKCPMTKICVA